MPFKGARVKGRGGEERRQKERERERYNNSFILAFNHHTFKTDCSSDLNRCTHFP